MNLSIKQVKAFLILVEEDSFTKAADRMHISQPAFSNLIAGLEETVGYRLFDRDTRKVELNEDGVHFIKLAKKLYKVYQDTIQDIHAYKNEEQNKVSLAAMPSIIVHWIPELLRSYNQIYPNVSVSLIDTHWDQCIQSLFEGRVDMALTTATLSVSEISSELLFMDKFFLVCHKNHVLAQKDVIELEDLMDHDLLGFTKGTSLRHYSDQLLSPIHKTYILEINQLATMFGLVMANLGVTLLTELSSFQFKHPDIVMKQIKNVTLDRPIYLISRPKDTLPEVVQRFHSHIKKSIPLIHEDKK